MLYSYWPQLKITSLFLGKRDSLSCHFALQGFILLSCAASRWLGKDPVLDGQRLAPEFLPKDYTMPLDWISSISSHWLGSSRQGREYNVCNTHGWTNSHELSDTTLSAAWLTHLRLGIKQQRWCLGGIQYYNTKLLTVKVFGLYGSRQRLAKADLHSTTFRATFVRRFK